MGAGEPLQVLQGGHGLVSALLAGNSALFPVRLRHWLLSVRSACTLRVSGTFVLHVTVLCCMSLFHDTRFASFPSIHMAPRAQAGCFCSVLLDIGRWAFSGMGGRCRLG